MRIIILHTVKLDKQGNPHVNFTKRLDKLIEISNETVPDLIILSGGKTRKSYEAECEVGYKYLLENQFKFLDKVELEKESKNTYESIVLIKGNYQIDKPQNSEIFVITSKTSLKRFKLLYKTLLPDIYNKIKFMGADDNGSLGYRIREEIYYIYTKLDQNHKIFPQLGKVLFRNG